MKIVYLCEFSEGICGVWNAVYNLSKEMVNKGHEVYVLSSNRVKGINKIAKSYEVKDGIEIYRFPVIFNIGENALFWKFSKKLKEINPDIVHAHVYRHPHSTLAPKLAEKIKAKSILTTHSPFVDRKLRGIFLHLFTVFYDGFIGKKNLKSYDKVIAITKWEFPYLKKLGLNNIEYIPNGLDKEFSKVKISKSKNILFLGRITLIKDVETLIKAMRIVIDNKKVKLNIVGPISEDYSKKLKSMINNFNLNKYVSIKKPVFNLKEKINVYKKSGIFVLPSKREGMPQALIEAMATGLVSISSDTDAGKEIINDKRFLFRVGNEKDLASKILFVLNNLNKLQKVRKKNKGNLKKFTWDKIADKTIKIYRK